MKCLARLCFACCFVLVVRGQAPEELSLQLRTLKRVYVDKFGGGEGAAQIRDMLIASLQGAKLFVITENPERADAVLRGSGEDQVFTDLFQTSDGINARSNLGVGKGSSTKGRDYLSLGGGVGDNEQSRIQERKHEASASVRIVNKDGDVIWSTTQESQGAKFRSASADVADKITRQLVLEFGRGPAPPLSAPPPPGTAPSRSVAPPSK
ncbi:hypothetical protein [Paludibaculum fermentans]|uniref:DUF4136 domain-containing protein n=1 Tax=Paludibaculum fermentans TaxID=1473598 RepID=A0A7S7NP82_PALFE|nr:hypothetical protein [Paludibaculum fermentans]QOY86744.1 hypothetical protein IRI77_28755 [Paludibaculum fermentans]